MKIPRELFKKRRCPEIELLYKPKGVCPKLVGFVPPVIDSAEGPRGPDH